MQDFTNNTLDIASLPQFEAVPLNKISKKYWNVVLLNTFIFLLLLAAGLVVLFFLNQESRSYIYPVAGAYIVLSLLLILLFRASIRRRGFALRENDIIYKSGIISISTSIVPFARVQHITLDEGIFSRMYQLASLQILTAGGASGSITIAGIEVEEAQKIKDILTRQLAGEAQNGTTI